MYAHICPVHTDPSAGCIQAEGVQQFCQDLDVDPMDVITVRMLLL